MNKSIPVSKIARVLSYVHSTYSSRTSHSRFVLRCCRLSRLLLQLQVLISVSTICPRNGSLNFQTLCQLFFMIWIQEPENPATPILIKTNILPFLKTPIAFPSNILGVDRSLTPRISIPHNQQRQRSKQKTHARKTNKPPSKPQRISNRHNTQRQKSTHQTSRYQHSR